MFKTIAFAAALMSLAAMPVQALPGAPVQSGISDSDVMQVADGCGRGWFRDRYGRCRPMGGPVVVAPVVVAPVYAPRACPRGMRLNRYGRCVYY